MIQVGVYLPLKAVKRARTSGTDSALRIKRQIVYSSACLKLYLFLDMAFSFKKVNDCFRKNECMHLMEKRKAGFEYCTAIQFLTFL